MDILKAIQARKSVRGFKPDPVPKKVLREIIEIASRSPSGMNTQPWDIAVVAGEVLDNIRWGNIEKLTSGAIPNPDVPSKRFEGKYRERQVEVAVQIFQLMNIAREDKEKRTEWQQRGFRFFDAPAAFIMSVDRTLEELHSQFDIGAIAQTICLTALNYGLGTCIEDVGVMFPEVVRRFTQISDSSRIAIGIAIGYPDWDFPANKLETTREPVDGITTWYGFD
jgi:nitroreductase